MQPLFSYKPTAYIYVLPGSYKVALSIHTFRTEQQEFKEGDFQMGANSKGGAASEKQIRHAQTIPTTFNITYRRATRVCLRTTERM